jgi:hypothetical protein
VLSRAEVAAVALLSLPAAAMISSYSFDAIGLGLRPVAAAVVGLTAALASASAGRWARPSCASALIFFGTTAGTAATLLWIARPSFLPGGSGPDLTHHLMLIDYLERHGTLVHDPDAWRQLGEMAYYTPGFHLLAVIAGHLSGVGGFFAVYPIVAVSVALKFGFVALLIVRLVADDRRGGAAAVAGVAVLLHTSSLTLHSFMQDSFLAQVVAEVFAVAMLWALVVWSDRPSSWMMLLFGIAGAATFLTWPVWLGPLLLALSLTIGSVRTLALSLRLQHAAIAIAPIALIAAMHTAGRVGALSIVATSGAVASPSLGAFDWWLLPLALLGLGVAMKSASTRVIVWLTGALFAQALALWAVAEWKLAATPYMAIKMTYLLAYLAAAAAAIALATLVRVPSLSWALALVAIATGLQDARVTTRPAPVVQAELYEVGVWARMHLPTQCIDYLVGNEYTAYWLHLAVLGNSRLTERTANDDLYRTEPAFARWIEDGGVPYAIARSSVLPADIRERTRILKQAGEALVIERLDSTRVPADGTCVASSPATGA